MAFMDQKYLLESESALAIFSRIKDLPIVDAHNHADVAEIAANLNYSNPWQVFAATDHYVWETMRKREIPEELITGKNTTPREKWNALAKVMPEIAGNPVYEWIHLDLRRRFGINEELDESTAGKIWDKVNADLQKEEFKPLALLKAMNVEVMCSTDDPCDTLEFHGKVNAAAGRTLIRPTWRPDKAARIWKSDWKDYLKKLGARWNTEIKTLDTLVEVLKKSHDFFAEMGCKASDHDTPVIPSCKYISDKAASMIFDKKFSGTEVTEDEKNDFADYLSTKFGEWNAEKGWVYQMHIGVRRDVRAKLFAALGPDVGGDVSDHNIDIVRPLCSFLNYFDGKLKVDLYCLEPAHYADLATVARAFGSTVRLGSAWWLCDTPIGMKRQLEYIATVDVLYDFAGMVSDSRKILSYASRFEMFRRVMANVLGNFVELGQMSYKTAENIAVRMAYGAPKEFFSL